LGSSCKTGAVAAYAANAKTNNIAEKMIFLMGFMIIPTFLDNLNLLIN